MRNLTAAFAVVLATLIAPLVIGGLWVSERVDDRRTYVDTVAGLADDPAVRAVLAHAAADAAVDALQEQVPVGLPDAVRDWADAAAMMIVESPAFPEFWREANGDLHDQVLAVLEDPAAPANGSITIDASPLVAQVLLQLEEKGIPADLLPDIRLEVPVEREAKVAEAGPAYRTADAINRLLPLAWIGLVMLASVVSRGGWRGGARTMGFTLLGVALAAGAILVLADPIAAVVTDRVAVDRQGLAGVLLDAVLDSLKPYARGWLVTAVGGVLLVAVSLWPRAANAPSGT